MVRILTDPADDGWANILALGGTFTWEVWEPSDANGDSMSHGWGSNVLVEIQRWLLGVTPTARATPHSTSRRRRAACRTRPARFPRPRGPVSVAWQRPGLDGSAFSLDLTVPPNATATLAVPASSASTVTESGRPLSGAAGARLVSARGGTVVVRVGAGRYTFRAAS